MKEIILGGVELAIFMTTIITGWVKIGQKVEDKLGALKDWQISHERESDDRDGKITDLRLLMAQQRQINLNTNEKLDQIIRYMEKQSDR